MSGSPFDELRLRQYPRAKQGLAWNSADALLVMAARDHSLSSNCVLVVNDEFGALCVALQGATLWTDSYLASLSLRDNLSRNDAASVQLCWSTEDPTKTLSLARDVTVVMRAPKQLAYFVYQLSKLSRTLAPGTTVLVAGMDKHLSPATAELMETYIGPTQRHRGQRKARLFSALRDERQPAPYVGDATYYNETLQGELLSLANGFAREAMDIGSRFLLQNLGLLAPAEKIIDLACGNGIIGLTALKKDLGTSLLLCDESAMAIASARINAHKLFPRRDISFYHGDGLLHYPGSAADLILCNPPFHLNHRIDQSVGRRLLVQAAAHLSKGGCLCLVANRHLNYLPVLKREFKHVHKLAQNSKFIIWQANA